MAYALSLALVYVLAFSSCPVSAEQVELVLESDRLRLVLARDLRVLRALFPATLIRVGRPGTTTSARRRLVFVKHNPDLLTGGRSYCDQRRQNAAIVELNVDRRNSRTLAHELIHVLRGHQCLPPLPVGLHLIRNVFIDITVDLELEARLLFSDATDEAQQGGTNLE